MIVTIFRLKCLLASDEFVKNDNAEKLKAVDNCMRKETFTFMVVHEEGTIQEDGITTLHPTSRVENRGINTAFLSQLEAVVKRVTFPFLWSPVMDQLLCYLTNLRILNQGYAGDIVIIARKIQVNPL